MISTVQLTNSVSFVNEQECFLKGKLSFSLSKTMSAELVQQMIKGDLQCLSLEGLPVTDQDLELLLSYCPKLLSCDLSECTLLTDACLKFLPSQIQHLFIRGLPLLTEKVLDCLPPSLISLDLSQNAFSLSNLHKLTALKHLENLYLWQCRQLQDQDLQWMEGKKLVRVDVSYCTRLTNQSLSMLTGVEDLSLDGLNYISKEGVSALVKSNRLKKVSLCRCRLITEDVILALAFKGTIVFQPPLLSHL